MECAEQKNEESQSPERTADNEQSDNTTRKQAASIRNAEPNQNINQKYENTSHRSSRIYWLLCDESTSRTRRRGCRPRQYQRILRHSTEICPASTKRNFARRHRGRTAHRKHLLSQLPIYQAGPWKPRSATKIVRSGTVSTVRATSPRKRAFATRSRTRTPTPTATSSASSTCSNVAVITVLATWSMPVRAAYTASTARYHSRRMIGPIRR